MKVGCKSGVAWLCELRTSCSRIRGVEYEAFFFLASGNNADENHGFVGGEEVSAKMIGNVFRKIQESIEDDIFGVQLHPNFKQNLNAIKVRGTEKGVGYWFGSDIRNKLFID